MENKDKKNKLCYTCTFERQGESLQDVILRDYIFAYNLVDAYNISLKMMNEINSTFAKNEKLFELASVKRNDLYLDMENK